MLAGKQHVLVLEPSNIEQLKDGKPVKTPDGEVLVCYTPDSDWLAKEMTKIISGNKHELDVPEFDKLLQESLDRPTIYKDGEKVKRIF